MGEHGWRTGAVVALGTGMFVAGCAAGCTFGVLTSSDRDGGTEDTSRVDTTPSTTRAPTGDAAFSNTIASLPIAFEDARLLAASACLAFKQNPGTSIPGAARQLAGQQGWTVGQATTFLNASTESYCPEYRAGS